ncbi:MAG: hypothetical protein H7Z37_04630, partial [Pyrinomonadaceae bacterium]|nr:hypothetical protein [Pyrinomonadaceae bacterium]
MSEQNQNLAQTIKQRLRSMKDRNDRKTLTELAKDLGRLPSDKSRVALEIAANLAGVSLRASKEFLQAAGGAADVLSPDDLRSWGELGRKLAMTNADTGVKYFADGVENFREIPEQSRTLVFQVCLRQLVLSSAVAVETFHLAPEIAASVKDEDSLNKIFGVAAEIAKRSAKHSADFLKNTVKLVAAIESFGAERFDVLREAARLANIFAVRTGGMAADLWAILPEALNGLSAENAKKLLKGASNFLDYGGSVTLHFVSAGGEGLRRIDMSFDAWCNVADSIAKNGNATLAAFLRSSSQFFAVMSGAKHKNLSSLTNRVLRLTQEVAAIDAESALACFRSSAKALRQVSVGQFEDWIREGLKSDKFETARARRSYFALETRRSFDRLHEGAEGLPLESVQGTLRMYVEGLTGRAIEIQAISAVMNESKINDGKTIYLPANVSEFGDDDLDFRLYKVLAAHAAGQIEFGTHEKDTAGLKAAYSSLAQLYEASAMETDAFSLAGYIEDVKSGESALSEVEEVKQAKAAKKRLPKNSDYKVV